MKGGAARPRSTRPLWALLLTLLLAGGSLLALVPGAPAQGAPQTPSTTPVLCFDRDPRAGACLATQPPSYQQGDSVDIRIDGFVGAQTYLSARCVRGCPALDPTSRNVYWALYRGGTVRFPRDFVDVGPDPDHPGANAVADQAPRYNSTWEVTADLADGDLTGAPISRQFFVWLYDAFVGSNFTVRPGESHYLRSTGYAPGAEVTYRWERREPVSGRYEAFRGAPAFAQTTLNPGWFEDYFALPPREARNITACGQAVSDCYRIVIGGSGKQAETVNVQVGLAEIKRNSDTTPRLAGNTELAFQRTQNASFDIDLHYPGGRVRHGPKLLPTDVPVSVTYGTNALRVVVEKVYRGNDSVHLIGEVPLLFDASRLVWNALWTIPKDLPLEPSQPKYRLRLVEQPDSYGNRIVEDVLANFTVDVAEIRPHIAEMDRFLPRTQQTTLRVAVLYHNGTSFTPAEAAVEGNTSPLAGCFVRLPPPPPPPAPPAQPQVQACGPNDPLTWGTYFDGSWNFTKRYARDYPNLDEHRFILLNNTVDRWGNRIFHVASDAFRVVPARPEVAFSTVQRGKEAELLERGNRIFVSATITYHDGAPYNHNVRVNPNSSEAMVLNGTLQRRGPGPEDGSYGPLAGEERFLLTESDPNAGRWVGYLQLTEDDTATPAGIWTFHFDIADNLSVPNQNVTAFDREIVSSTIQVCPTFQPPSRVATGTTIKFRFRLQYSDCDSGREVPSGALEGRLNARVHRFDPDRHAVFGAPVSNTLIPFYARGTTLDWGIEYEVANQLFSGTYAILITGADTFGNKIVPNATSRSFATYTDVLNRTVLTQPPSEVRRGDSATVVFDAREGDTGVDPARPFPRIQLERFDTSTTTCSTGPAEGGCWVREWLDTRIQDASFTDHVGVFPVGIDTPVGVYRFSLQGRDRDHHIITGVSTTFTVDATQVTRALNTLPPERIVKGVPFQFYVDQMPGDQLRERVVFHNGRPLQVPLPLLTNEYGRINVSWAVPFEAPTGNYTLRLAGRDVNGNNILVLTPPIEAVAATLEGRLLGQPTRAAERGGDARVTFAVTYPDGGFYAAADTPRVFVRNATGVVAAAEVRREGLSFAAEWAPPASQPLGEYYFEVSPQPTGGTGNEFTPLRSNTFRVVPGRFVRDPIDELGAEVERLGAAIYGVPFAADDKYAGFELAYYGPSLSTAVSREDPLVEITRSPLPHTIDAASGKYVARLVTDHQSQVGTFKIHMTGEDAHGNRIQSESRPFVIRPTTIGITFERFPSQDQFGEGKTITISFVARYRIGTIMDESYGRPSVVALYNDRPITQRPEVQFLDGRWYLSWTAPEVLPDGQYEFAIGGTDLQGNPIASARSTPYLVRTDLAESFAKAIPGPSPVLALIAVAGAAALLAGRRPKSR